MTIQVTLFWVTVLLGSPFSLRHSWEGSVANHTEQPVIATVPALSPADDPMKGVSDVVPKVDFQDAQPVVMSSIKGTQYQTTVFVRNDEFVKCDVSFSALLQDEGKAISVPNVSINSGTNSIPIGNVAPLTIVLDVGKARLPLTGYLQLIATTSTSSKPTRRYRMLKVPSPSPSGVATGLYWTSFIAASGIVVLALGSLHRGDIRFSQRMGPSTWNFSDSWGTNITVGGALLTTLLGFGALPDPTHYCSRVAYFCLSLLFAGLITLGPSIYALFRTPVYAPGSLILQYQGYVWSFTIASGIVVWGTLGQLETIALVFAELEHSKVLSATVTTTFAVVVGLVWILLLFYGYQTITELPGQQKVAAEQQRVIEMQARSQHVGADTDTATPRVGVHLPTWPGL